MGRVALPSRRALVLAATIGLAGMACAPPAWAEASAGAPPRSEPPASRATSTSTPVWYLPDAPSTRPAVHGLIQLDAVGADEQAATPEGDPVAPGGQLELRRAYLSADDRLAEHTVAVVRAGLVPTLDRGVMTPHWVTDAWIAYDRWLLATPIAGVTRVPLTRTGLVPEGEEPLPFAPLAIAARAPDRRPGAALVSDAGIVRAVAGAYELAPPAGGVLAGGRVEIEPIGPVGRTLSADDPASPWYRRPRVCAGGAAYVGMGGLARGVDLAAADLALKWGPVALTGEWLLDREQAATYQGADGMASVFVVPGRLEVIGRYSYYARTATRLPGALDAGPPNAVDLGVRWRASGTLRVTAAGRWRTERNILIVEVGAGF